jgi:hypothetical protein
MNGASGPVDCLVIPIAKNHLFIGEKGIYLDIAGFEIKNPAEGMKDTHILKQSLPKEVYQAMSEDDRKKQPILGNLRLWAGGFEADPVGDITPKPETDDLPF